MPTQSGDAATTPGAATPWRSFPLPPHQPDELPALRQQFPGYDIWRETTGERTSYIARRRHHGLSPHTVVTGDPDELRAALHQDEYPQAIADDYPGWQVTHQDGQWTASCPAMTVHAPTAAGLRTAIENAISPDGPHPEPPSPLAGTRFRGGDFYPPPARRDPAGSALGHNAGSTSPPVRRPG